MTRRVAITQSNYLPWKGYFDMIQSVDQLFLYDEVQFTRRDWRNRNQIKTSQGISWLTVPVLVKGKYDQMIDETLIADRTWAAKHWATIYHAYARAPFFDEYSKPFRLYLESSPPDQLSRVNRDLIEIVMGLLAITTPLASSREVPITASGKSERLVSICLAAGATTYVSGPAARDYLDTALFERHGISVEWFSYEGYPQYEQLHGPFVHQVSIIDLILNTGPNAPDFLQRRGM